MRVSTYEKLLGKVAPRMNKMRHRALPADMCLLITLRYLGPGDNMQSLALAYRVGRSTVCVVVHETTQVLWAVLQPEYLAPPTLEDLLRIACDFYSIWGMPNCIWSIDGKHVNIQAPFNSHSLFFNYKGDFGVVLLAICDARYNFMMIDVGAYGSQSDCGIFANSNFGMALEAGVYDIPPPSSLPGYDPEQELHHCLVGDSAFPLKTYLMRPYPKKQLNFKQNVFNYRFSRGRRVIENTFGVLASRWRLFRQSIIAHETYVGRYIKAAVCLHNFIRAEEVSGSYCPPNFIDTELLNGTYRLGDWRKEGLDGTIFKEKPSLGSNNAKGCAFSMRDQLTDYVNSESSTRGVEWQFDYVNSGHTL